MKRVWELQISGKVKHFVWKVIRGVLPCYGTLAGRHIPVTGQCPICHIGFEDAQHCLFTCERAMNIWSELGLKEEIHKAVLEDRSGSFTMSSLMDRHDTVSNLSMAELTAVGSWYIWWQRRQMVKGEMVRQPNQTAISIKVLATNFIRSLTPNQPVVKRDHMRHKPKRGAVKINVDASFSAETMTAGTGAVA